MIDKPKTALVTGSSRGIGAETAIWLAEHGYDVCVNYLSNQTAAEIVADKIKSLGRKSICIQADVSQESEVIRLFNEIDQQLGQITHLVNNAGILFQQTDLLGLTEERINQILMSNVTSVILCTREAVKRMKLNDDPKECSIVNVSSRASVLGAPGEYLDYAASKGAVDSLTIGLSKELAHWGIRVNAVRPGFIDTDIHASGGEPDRIERVKSAIPLNRGGEAIEVAKAIGWLLSDEASYSTGAFIDISGGR